MTNKSTKRALLSSVIALLLCFSMLLGTTYAWFTDSVTSGNNIIQSGNLDIELEYWNGSSWVDVKDASDILTNELWEPGVTEVAYLRVANAGSLVLKYQLGINILNEIEGKNQANETFKLSDYIMFGVVEDVNGQTDAYTKDDAGRAEAIADVTDAKKISTGYTKASTMNPGDELYLALVVYMPTDIGNVANHNGTDVPQIDLGINVLATQMTAENDSFNDQYDKDADFFVEVSDFADLAKALASGGKIVLANDITITKDDLTNDPALASIPVGMAIVGTDVTLDLNGNDITIAAQDGAAIHVKNGNLTIVGDGTISNVGTSGYVVWAKGASTVNVYDGAFFAGGDDTTLFYASGSVAYDPNSDWATVNIYGGTFTNEAVGDSVQDYLNVMNHGVGRISIYGGTFDFDPANTAWGDDKAYITVAPTYQVIDNGDGTYTVAPPVVANKTQIKNTIEEAFNAGATETTVDAQGADIGDLDYALSTDSVKEGTQVTIKNAVVSSKSYGNMVNGTVVFENCKFTAGLYSIHFADDSKTATGTGVVIFKNCDFVGWNSFGSGLKAVEMYDCTLVDNGTYGIIRSYVDLYMENCSIDVTGSNFDDAYYDGVQVTDGVTLTMVNCTEAVANVNGFKNALASGGDIHLLGTVDLGGTKGNYLTLTEDTTITGGTIKGTGWTGELNYAVNATSGNIVFDGVTFDTTDWTTEGWANWGISVNVNGTANVTFKNCTFKGGQCPIYQSGSESVVTLENCTFDTTSVAIQCEIYSGDFSLGQDLIVKNCDFTGVADVLHIYDYDKDPSSDTIAQYLTDNGNTFTGICKQTCK